MPYKDREINKLYYPISEVAEIMGVNASLLRFWEKEFDILKPKKNKKGNRMFTPEDVENIKIIYHLVKEKGMTLQGAREYLKTKKHETEDKQKIIDTLAQLKAFLLDIRDRL